VEGLACNRVQDGTGFVVGPDLVATNAHVVAGESDTEVVRDDGSRATATVVAFEPERDIALLRVRGMNRPPLPLGESSLGATGGVFGHPGGGPLRIAPFAVASQLHATGRDIYGTSLTTRDILELRSGLRPGDSGSPLVDPAGAVVGVAFAIAPDKPDVAYALAMSELQAVLDAPRGPEVGTGACTGT
jgi:S1-C subfamily serine protease